MEPVVFGSFRGAKVHRVTLGHADGLQARVMTWGAVICDLSLPYGATRLPLTLGFDSFDLYPAHSPYFGAVVGRFANRIAHGRFALAGQSHQLARNEGPTTLHGGPEGFARQLWRIADLTETSVVLALTSPDGDQGFPGRVEAMCTYTIADRALEVGFRATTDRATPLNLAQHAYFNLDGGPDTGDHALQIFADSYTPVDRNQIPTGEINRAEGTVFDFRQTRALRTVEACDHNFVLTEPPGADGLRPAARLVSRRSGVAMEVRTTKPGLQFYDGRHLGVTVPGLGGRAYGPRAGLCLETQFFPDSPNRPGFPDSVLHPGDVYAQRTVFAFDGPDRR